MYIYNRPVVFVFAMAALLSASACSHKEVRSEEPATPAASDTANSNPNIQLELTHFAYNSAKLSKEGKRSLTQDAQALKENPNVKIRAQGFCDDRGSIQYNLALGQKRAEAVKAFLISIGISADRITTESFGKADPLDPKDNEKAWALNRRASFVVVSNGSDSKEVAGR